MKRRYIILLHIAFWGLLVLNQTFPIYNRNPYHAYRALPKGTGLFLRYLITTIGFYSITALCFYANYFFVAPQLFIKKNYWKSALYAVLVLAALLCWRYIIEFYFFKPVMGFDNYMGHPISVKYYVENVFYYYFPVYFIYGMMYFFVENWYKTQQRQQELYKEQAAAELTFLRSQINPHFLFNSINDIYSLSYQQSAQAPVALLKLSEILRYMLRDSNSEFMPLQSEIKYLENVIALQHISAKGNAYIQFNVDGYIGNQQVATLLFIAFVENAFKHGVLTDPQTPVKISIGATNNKVSFEVSNKKNHDQKDHTGGIGLYNVRRRLTLIYPGRHQLIIKETAEYYTVNLDLQLL